MYKTGNPVFPYFNGVFKSQYFKPENFVDRNWTGHLNWDLPWDLTYHTIKFSQTVDGSAGLYIIFMVAAALGFFSIKKRLSYALIPFFLGIVYVLAVAVQIQYLRYFFTWNFIDIHKHNFLVSKGV